jgi:AbiV family abortive infection protein
VARVCPAPRVLRLFTRGCPEMCAKKLDQYTGKLDPEQIAMGMNAASRNAQRLAADAVLLFESERYCSAIALAILSIEESGKLSILRLLAVAKSAEEAKQCWRDYRSHTKKNVMATFVDLFRKGARRLDQFASLFDQSADHPHLIDQVKQLALYTDCLANAHWSEPEDVFDVSLAHIMVTTASLFAKREKITALEIELWIEHVGPHLYGNRELAKRGLELCYVEMQRHGLAAPGRNEMAIFINEGVDGLGASESRPP